MWVQVLLTVLLLLLLLLLWWWWWWWLLSLCIDVAVAQELAPSILRVVVQELEVDRRTHIVHALRGKRKEGGKGDRKEGRKEGRTWELNAEKK